MGHLSEENMSSGHLGRDHARLKGGRAPFEPIAVLRWRKAIVSLGFGRNSKDFTKARKPFLEIGLQV